MGSVHSQGILALFLCALVVEATAAPPETNSPRDYPWREQGYEWKHPAGDLAPFPQYPTVAMIDDPDAPVWAHLQFRQRKALGDLARLYMALHSIPKLGEITAYDDRTWQFGWFPDYVALTGDAVVRDYCTAWRDSFNHSVRNEVGQFYRGFVRSGDIDHQNEDVIRFLIRLPVMDPKDPENSYCIRSLAPLLGNWQPGTPAWYDYDRHRWRGYWMGSEHVKEDFSDKLEDPGPFSWLCLIALQAYQSTGEKRYLALVEDFCSNQAKDIAARGIKNQFLGVAVYGGAFGQADFYGSTYGIGPWKGGSFRLGGGLTGIYLDLFQITGKQEYLTAAQTFLDEMMPDMLYHTRAMSALPQLAQYRRVTGDPRYDATVMTWLDRTRDRADSLHMITEACDPKDRKLDWLHGCETRTSPSPMTWSLAALISGNDAHRNRAIELAIDRTRAIYAEESRPSTRVSSAGDWNWFSYLMAWEVADVFFATTGKQYGGSNESLDRYEVRYFRPEGTQGLPAHVAAQHLPQPGRMQERTLRFYNAGDEPAVVHVRPESIHPVMIAALQGRDADKARIQGADVVVKIPAHQTVRLVIALSDVPR